MQEYLTECLVKERIAHLEALAVRSQLVREARGPRRPLRIALGLGLIRAGQCLLRGVPAWAAEPRSPA
jgi:hypothetical protein